MTINAMRCYILDSYPHASKDWRNKVAFTMKPNQIIAIFRSISERDAKKKEEKKQDEQYHQIDIFEYLARRDALSDAKGSHTQIAL